MGFSFPRHDAHKFLLDVIISSGIPFLLNVFSAIVGNSSYTMVNGDQPFVFNGIEDSFLLRQKLNAIFRSNYEYRLVAPHLYLETKDDHKESYDDREQKFQWKSRSKKEISTLCALHAVFLTRKQLVIARKLHIVSYMNLVIPCCRL